MIDGFGGMKAPDERIEELRAAGGASGNGSTRRASASSPASTSGTTAAPSSSTAASASPAAPAVMDKWLGNARGPEHWRDTMVEVRGCIAGSLQSAFTQLWAHVTGEMLDRRCDYLSRRTRVRRARPTPG
jgi:hypothetical protein